MTTVHKQHPLDPTVSGGGTYVLEISGDPNGLVYGIGSLALQRDAAAPHSGWWGSLGGGTWTQLAAWLDDLADVATAGAVAGDALTFNGATWGPVAAGAAVGSVSGTGGVIATTSGSAVTVSLDPAFLLATT